MKTQNQVILIIEKNGEEYWTSVKELPGVYSSGTSIDEAITNTKIAISEFTEDIPDGLEVPMMFLNGDINFKIQYDLESLFEKFDFLNKSAIAEKAGINASLVRQYSKGLAHASDKQKSKIISAIHELATDLLAATA